MKPDEASTAALKDSREASDAGAAQGEAARPRRPLRVRFVGSQGRFNSVATQAVRVHNGLKALHDPWVHSELLLLPRGALTSRFPGVRQIKTPWRRLTRGVDVLVLVKPSLFWGFQRIAPSLKAWCERQGVLLVSAPADGAAGHDQGTPDRFTNEIADFVFTISPVQYELAISRRDPSTVFQVGTATRPGMGAAVEIRDTVKTVVWENPPHHDPYFNPERNGIPREMYDEFEREIHAFCRDRGASLLTFGFWRDEDNDDEWQRLLLSADVAIECKSLEQRYTTYQLRKPAVKLRNYLALGLPVVCDSLPSHLEAGTPAGVLFADTLDEWKDRLGRLFESRELRAEMSARAREAVADASIESVTRRYVSCLEEMLARRESGRLAVAGARS